MNISRQFKQVSSRFVVIVIGLSVLSVGLLSFVLYETNNIRFDSEVSSSELHSTIKDDEAVSQYVESEKSSEAHFITIASLVKQDQQQALGQAVLIATAPVIIVVAGLGYLVAKYLLRPVRESYESQERFLQDAAHELRNPLAAMSLAIENARSNSATDTEFLTTMSRQTKRLIHINEDLLYLERRVGGETISSINISELLEDVLEDVQALLTHKKLKLHKDIQADIFLKIDQKDFIKLARNIVENAIKYSKTGKKVIVKMQMDKQITLTVKDQGIGIPEADLEHIGERFYRSKNTGRIDGTGLGLAIVRKVLNLYGGDIIIASKINKGTTVVVTF